MDERGWPTVPQDCCPPSWFARPARVRVRVRPGEQRYRSWGQRAWRTLVRTQTRSCVQWFSWLWCVFKEGHWYLFLIAADHVWQKLNIGFVLKTIQERSLKLWMVIISTWLYIFIPILMILTFQGCSPSRVSKWEVHSCGQFWSSHIHALCSSYIRGQHHAQDAFHVFGAGIYVMTWQKLKCWHFLRYCLSKICLAAHDVNPHFALCVHTSFNTLDLLSTEVMESNEVAESMEK